MLPNFFEKGSWQMLYWIVLLLCVGLLPQWGHAKQGGGKQGNSSSTGLSTGMLLMHRILSVSLLAQRLFVFSSGCHN